MQPSADPRVAASRAGSLKPTPALLGLAIVAAARLLTLPRSPWEGDEILFLRGIANFDPLHHSPHPPGYPLLIGLGKLFNLVFHDPFASLVALSVLSSLAGYLALVAAFRRMAPGPDAELTAVAGALLFHLSPAMLVYGPLALSDPPAVMFLSLALAAAVRLPEGGDSWSVAFGAAASAAVGCRPQLAVAVLPMLAVTLVLARNARRAAVALGAFTAVSLAWFLPLLAAVGGFSGFVAFLGKQASLVVAYDAQGPRMAAASRSILVRFLAHPWGQRWTSLPVLAAAAVGAGALAGSRRREAVPLVLLAGVDLAFALAAMNPDDAVRYALPSLLGVSFAAAVGLAVLARRFTAASPISPGWAALSGAILLGAGCAVYTAPLLRARATLDSPPVQAARWIERTLPARSILLTENELAPHAAFLLRRFTRAPIASGPEPAAARSCRPVYLLADGVSGWPGATTFRWPDSDAFGKLTRGRLGVVSVSPLPPGRSYSTLRGVHAYEPSARDPAAWRWLDADAALRVALCGRQAKTAAVTLALPNNAALPVVTVSMTVDGAPAAEVTIERGSRRTVLLPLPAGADSAEISFRADRAFVPAEAGIGPDSRSLAVQLIDLALQGR